MNKPHVHQEVIIAWANGAKIQYQHRGDWLDIDRPCFETCTKYRVKSRHQAAKDAYQAGAEIEIMPGVSKWLKCTNPSWDEALEYRIKPEREWPVTSLSAEDCYSVYYNFSGSLSDILVIVANAAIKQYIIDTERDDIE